MPPTRTGPIPGVSSYIGQGQKSSSYSHASLDSDDSVLELCSDSELELISYSELELPSLRPFSVEFIAKADGAKIKHKSAYALIEITRKNITIPQCESSSYGQKTTLNLSNSLVIMCTRLIVSFNKG